MSGDELGQEGSQERARNEMMAAFEREKLPAHRVGENLTGGVKEAYDALESRIKALEQRDWEENRWENRVRRLSRQVEYFQKTHEQSDKIRRDGDNVILGMNRQFTAVNKSISDLHAQLASGDGSINAAGARRAASDMHLAYVEAVDEVLGAAERLEIVAVNKFNTNAMPNNLQVAIEVVIEAGKKVKETLLHGALRQAETVNPATGTGQRDSAAVRP